MNSSTSRPCVGCAGAIILGLYLLSMANLASGQMEDIPPTWGGDLVDRPRLTGSWFGVRDEMGKKGVTLDIDLLQTPQSVVSGGVDQKTEYGGLGEYTLNVNTQKLGLWPGGFLNVQGMTSFGKSVNSAAGALIPTTFTSLLPEPNQDQTDLISFTYMQFLSEKFGLFAGKLSTLGGTTTRSRTTTTRSSCTAT